jgi:hypothetical protein
VGMVQLVAAGIARRVEVADVPDVIADGADDITVYRTGGLASRCFDLPFHSLSDSVRC